MKMESIIDLVWEVEDVETASFEPQQLNMSCLRPLPPHQCNEPMPLLTKDRC